MKDIIIKNENIVEFEKTAHHLELEEMFRSCYMKSGDSAYQLPHSLSYFDQVIKKAVNQFPDSFTLRKCASLLNEDTFFEEGSDTVFHPHVSWFPPIWHVNHFFVIQVVLKGSVKTYIANQELCLEKGNVCIVAPNSRHAISCFSDDSYVLKILIRTSSFEQAFFGLLKNQDTVLAEFFARTLYSNNPHPYLMFSCGWDNEMMDYIAKGIRESNSHRSLHAQMLNCIMSQFFITLLRDHEKDLVFPESSSIRQSENLIFILKYIQDHATTITLSQVAELFNYSERHIQRVLKKNTGKSFTEIIQTIRMNEAARLLKDSHYPISAIASDVGYNNLGNFRKIFNKTFQMSPAEYRKKASSKST